MGIIIKQNDERTKLQERIAAELKEKMSTTSLDDQELPDLVEGSEYVKDFEKESTLKFWIKVFAILILVAIMAVLFFIFKN
ncbi:MAG: hypothetical protein LBE03_02380 [Candidatus Nomurabacteria bacterium]|jgi:hypothetical protein|nr:hypothetical protein [Candidatus Nomurabacteria bacterium]